MMNLRMVCRYVACNVSTSWIMDYVFGVIKYHGVTLRYFWSNLRMMCIDVACNVYTNPTRYLFIIKMRQMWNNKKTYATIIERKQD